MEHNEGEKIVTCLKCGKTGKRKGMDIVPNADGHCGIGDLAYA